MAGPPDARIAALAARQRGQIAVRQLPAPEVNVLLLAWDQLVDTPEAVLVRLAQALAHRTARSLS